MNFNMCLLMVATQKRPGCLKRETSRGAVARFVEDTVGNVHSTASHILSGRSMLLNGGRIQTKCFLQFQFAVRFVTLTCSGVSFKGAPKLAAGERNTTKNIPTMHKLQFLPAYGMGPTSLSTGGGTVTGKNAD